MLSALSSLQKLQLQKLDPSEFKCIVDSEIGELGCCLHSCVRLADHRTFGWVAIKCFIIRGGAPQKRSYEKKLKKKLQVLQQAMNNHVVLIFGWVKWSGSMGLVMEYMPGGNLGQFVSDDSDQLPLKVILRIGCQASDGIAYMHNLPADQRVVHGDLKPENVLLSPDLHCKIADFGCAQLNALTGSTTKSSARPANTDLTLAYAAPEKLQDFNTPVKKEQDTYSFGMLLYALLRGSPPFQHKSQEDAFIELIKRGDRPKTRPIDELKETLNNEDKKILETLQSIMKKCWQQDPSDRPTMIEVRDELQRLLRLQSQADILKEVTEVVDTLSISIPNADEHQLLPLHYFSPIDGTFRQANAVEQQERQQIATTEADDLRSSAKTSTKRSLKADKKPIHAKEKAETSSSSADMDSKLLSERRPTLSEFFESSDPALPSDVQADPRLLENYKFFLKIQNYEEAKTMTTKITSMIEGNTNATAKEVKEFGTKHREKKHFLESIAFFDAAFAMFKKLEETEEILELIMYCAWEMRETNKAMIRDDASMKTIVRDYVIPVMREMLRHIEDTSSVSEIFKCLKVCCVLQFIEQSEGRVDEWEEREKTLLLALTRMKDVLKSDVKSYYIYGQLLHNLGTVSDQASRFEDAASFLEQAIDAFKAATDFDDEEEKKRLIETSEKSLKKVQPKMK